MDKAKTGQGDLVLAIAHRVDPSSIPCIDNTDPWFKVRLEVNGSLNYGSRIFLDTFLLARCFKGASCEPIAVLSYSFDRVYSATEDSRIPGDAWDLLSPMLPKRAFIFDWDKCARIRHGTVEQFVKKHFPASGLIRLTEKAWLFREIVRGIAEYKAGRSVLEEVYPHLFPSQKKIVTPLISGRR